MRIIGYSFEADYHCINCAKKRNFKLAPESLNKENQLDENGISIYSIDNEGNRIMPIFSTHKVFCCGDCLKTIFAIYSTSRPNCSIIKI